MLKSPGEVDLSNVSSVTGIVYANAGPWISARRLQIEELKSAFPSLWFLA